MSPNRYGDTETGHYCRNGWLSPDDADVAIPCPLHRPRKPSENNDYAERTPSARAQQAINAEENQ